MSAAPLPDASMRLPNSQPAADPYTQIPHAMIPGTVSSIRALEADRNGKTMVFAYGITIVAMGGTFDVQTRDRKLSESVGVGERVIAKCHFSSYMGKLRLDLACFVQPAK